MVSIVAQFVLKHCVLCIIQSLFGCHFIDGSYRQITVICKNANWNNKANNKKWDMHIWCVHVYCPHQCIVWSSLLIWILNAASHCLVSRAMSTAFKAFESLYAHWACIYSMNKVSLTTMETPTHWVNEDTLFNDEPVAFSGLLTNLVTAIIKHSQLSLQNLR